MKNLKSKRGPFSERPHFELSEIEEMCTAELSSVGLYPASPQPIRIDRFIEKRWKPPLYEDLPDGVLGFTKFGPRGVEAIVVSNALDDAEKGKPNERRLRTTLAHEAGHGLMHAHLFSAGIKPKALFHEDDERPQILCRDVPWKGEEAVARYDGRWWEFQANRAIGGLLLPKKLVEMAIAKLTHETGQLGLRSLPTEKRGEAARELSEIFDVNPIVARLRLNELFPRGGEAQLSL
jgi:hypothetical protein